MNPLPPVIEVNPADLVEDPDNANSMSPEDFALLVHSIRTVGFLQPILIKPPNTIVDGHHRKRAALEAGLTKVTAVLWDGTEEMRQVVSLGMNRIRGELDLGAVARRVTELAEQGWSMAQLTLTGFSVPDLEELVKSSQPENEDVLAQGVNTGASDPEPDSSPRPFLLELMFSSSEELQKVKRRLRREAGKGRELSEGLLKLLDERE